MKSKEQVIEDGAYTALHAFRDRCPSYVPDELKEAWRLGFGGACLRIMRETIGPRKAGLPKVGSVVQLSWRDRWRALLAGRVEISLVGEAIVVGELRGLARAASVSVDVRPVLATWREQRAERHERRLKARADADAARIAAAEVPALPPAEPATRTEP